MDNVKRSRNEVPTIDVNLVTIETHDGIEFGFDTANQIEVEVQTEENDAVKLVVKGRLRAQKPKEATITGHAITLHDNVFNPQLVKVLQGGKIWYWQDEEKTTMAELETAYGVAKYTPPVAGSADKGEVFTLNAYSAVYNAAGIITSYEKTSYPNCQGEPVAFNSEDGAFRAPTYTINSAPDEGEAPYDITWITSLPNLVDADKLPSITIPKGELFGKSVSELGNYYMSDGNVMGNINYISDYTGFSTNTEYQSGYYLALNVDKWQGNSVRLDRLDEDGLVVKGTPKNMVGDGNVVMWLGKNKEGAETAYQLVFIISGTEIKYDIKVTFVE